MLKEKSEHQEQCEFVRWFKLRFPEYKLYAIPNGGKRGKATGRQLKNAGVSKGAPDLCIPGLFIYFEFKKGDEGVVSVDQDGWIIHLRKFDYRAEIARSADEAKRIVLEEVERRRVT